MISQDIFTKYIGVFIGIAAVFSSGFFSLLLPKIFDYFNNKHYRDYKDMLDLRESLIKNKKIIDPQIDAFIRKYEIDFLESRTNQIQSSFKKRFYSTAWSYIGFIVIVVFFILGASMGIYQLFLCWVLSNSSA